MRAHTNGAAGVPQLEGATLGVQLAPPVSFFSLFGSLEGEPVSQAVSNGGALLYIKELWITVYKIPELFSSKVQ
jgi:hypothetical protein